MGSGPAISSKNPKTPPDAITGMQFARQTSGMTSRERHARATDELLRGNVPDFLRRLKPVELTYLSPEGERITALFRKEDPSAAFGYGNSEGDKPMLQILGKDYYLGKRG